jgi:L-fuculose-phosphate aldolase
VIGELVSDNIERATDSRIVPLKHHVEQLMSAVDSLARSSLLGASQGDISVRLPGADHMLITPLAAFVEKLDASDLIEIAGARLVRKRGRPSFSMQMHLAIYGSRPDVNAIVHTHAAVATVLGLCELPIPPVTFDSVPFVDLPRVPASALEQGQWPHEVANHLRDGAPAALLLNNGVVTVGEDLRQAVGRVLSLEETARILVVCHLLRQVPLTLPTQAVEILRDSLV